MHIEHQDYGFNETVLTTENETVTGLDFSGEKVDRFFAWDSTLIDCNFSKLRVKKMFEVSAGMTFTEYRRCNFDGADLMFGPGGWGRFIECTFRNARIKQFTVDPLDLIDCDFRGARLLSCIFRGSLNSNKQKDYPELRVVNEIRGNDFTDAVLKDTDFRAGVDLTAQKLPIGPDYAFALDGAKAIERMRDVASTWDPDHKDTSKIMWYSSHFCKKYDEGQKHLFVCRIRLADRSHWDQVRDAINQGQGA